MSDPLTDTRTEWPGKPGHANRPRCASAVAARFSAGKSIASLADDYGITTADVVLAIRVEIRALNALGASIAGAFEEYDKPRGFGV